MTEAVLSETFDGPAMSPPAEVFAARAVETSVEERLVLRSQAGDRPAFEELVRRTAKLVFARIYLETGRGEGTEDLVQETYLVAWRSIKQVTDAAGFRTWLLSVAHTVAIDRSRHLSRQKRGGSSKREDSDVLGSIPAATPGPAELAGKSESRQKVLAVLRGLPDDYRLPLTLRYLHGADYETIARQLGITTGSLRGLLHRGVAMMRREMIAAGIEL